MNHHIMRNHYSQWAPVLDINNIWYLNSINVLITHCQLSKEEQI